jgi:hypothetical protein
MAPTVTVNTDPPQVTQGGVVTFTTQLTYDPDTFDFDGTKHPFGLGLYLFKWTIEGPGKGSKQLASGQLGSLTPARGAYTFSEYRYIDNPVNSVTTDWDSAEQRPGVYTPSVDVTLLNPTDPVAQQLIAEHPELAAIVPLLVESYEQVDPKLGEFPVANRPPDDPFVVVIKPFTSGDRVNVTMNRAAMNPKLADASWPRIRAAAQALSWDSYEHFMNVIVCGDKPFDGDPPALGTRDGRTDTRKRVTDTAPSLPYPEIEPYRVLKAATEVFMTVNCGVQEDEKIFDKRLFDGMDLFDESARLNRGLKAGDLEAMWRRYLRPEDDGNGGMDILPYLALVRAKLHDVGIVKIADDPAEEKALMACAGILRHKLTLPTMIELIWSYWHEEAMLVQTLNAITWRFQNRRTAKRDPLATLEIDPLRPLNPLIWGFVQDEVFRLTLPRRAYEYDHHYGLSLIGKAVGGPVQGADSRSRFLEAFHHLLNLVSIFYKEDDDTTVIADGFPVLNALKEVHLLLTQGAHNQYGELPWVARQEMLMMQWMLARPEMREFLPTRIMVAYPEPWMDRVEAMKTLQGWSTTPVLHFRDLAAFGEQILLGIRFTAWTKIFDADTAGNWARYWRPEIQGYVHAYRAVTGVDLTARVESTQPAIHLQRRLTADMARR